MTAAARAAARTTGPGPGRRSDAAPAVPCALPRSAVLALVLALVLAPITAGTSVQSGGAVDDAAGAAASLSARWPILVDASVRATVATAGERTLDLPRRGVLLAALPAPARAPAVAMVQAEPRPPDLSMLGRRQSDGG